MGPYYGYLACPGCGVAVQRSELDRDVHRCVPERFVSHQTRQARPGLDRLGEDLASWLATPNGLPRVSRAAHHA
jgi:hypothetical protein